MTVFDYTPGPTGGRFMLSRAKVKLICGPVGGGKSTVALMELVRRAATQRPNAKRVRRTRFVVLRNTTAQLKSTVKPLMTYWLEELPGGAIGGWRHTDNIFHMRFALADGTTVESEFWLMAADTPEDVRRLLSVECSAAWVEEAREVDPVVFDGLQGRTNRFPNHLSGGVSEPGVICSTNPPPIGTWWFEKMTNPPKTWEIFMQPPALLEDGTLNPAAENLENLAPSYYSDLMEGKTEDWINVYLKNKFGLGGHGQPVYKGKFNSAFHVAKEPLIALPLTYRPLIVGMDNGLTAAAAITQQNALSQVLMLDECYVAPGDSMGVERFLETLLIPKLTNDWGVTPQLRNRVIFVLDPACFHRSQANELTIAQVVSSRGFSVVKAQTNDPERRIGAVETLLGRAIDGKPGFLVSPKCTYAIAGFEWGYRYKKNLSGQSTLTPDKTHHSHLHDGIQYSALHYGQGATAQTQIAAQPIQAVAYAW